MGPRPEDEQRGFGERFYRTFEAGAARRVPFRVRVQTTDLYLRADRNLGIEARAAAEQARGRIEAHIAAVPAFATALTPLEPPAGPVDEVVRGMYAAGRAAGTGPMAAVAGAIAGAVGRRLRECSREVVVENGGDLYLDVEEELVVGIYAGTSPLSGRLGLRVRPEQTPCGVCTSSGTVGPSLSYGRADAAVALAPDPALADAVATALGNRVRAPGDLQAAVEWARSIPGVTGAAVLLGAALAAVGDLEFVEI